MSGRGLAGALERCPSPSPSARRRSARAAGGRRRDLQPGVVSVRLKPDAGPPASHRTSPVMDSRTLAAAGRRGGSHHGHRRLRARGLGEYLHDRVHPPHRPPPPPVRGDRVLSQCVEPLRAAIAVQAEPRGARWPQLPLRAAASQKKLGYSALTLPPTGDDQALAAAMLVLDPRAAPSTFSVRSIEPLGDHTFETLLGRCREQRFAPADEVPRRAPRRPVQRQFGQQLTPPCIRKLAHSSAVEMQNVEHDQIRRPDPCCNRSARSLWPEARAQGREVGFAVGAEAHELAVEDHPCAGELLCDRGQLRELGGAVAPGTRPHARHVSVEPQLRTDPVPLDLHRPRGCARRRPRGREHRLEETRKVLTAGLLHFASVRASGSNRGENVVQGAVDPAELYRTRGDDAGGDSSHTRAVWRAAGRMSLSAHVRGFLRNLEHVGPADRLPGRSGGREMRVAGSSALPPIRAIRAGSTALRRNRIVASGPDPAADRPFAVWALPGICAFSFQLVSYAATAFSALRHTRLHRPGCHGLRQPFGRRGCRTRAGSR